MKQVLAQLAQIAATQNIIFGAFDPVPLFAGRKFEFTPEVEEFFTTCIPSMTLDLDLYRILSATDIRLENQDFIPSYFCAPEGFITIARELNGDAFALDVTTGLVHKLSHEKYENDGIHPGWNAENTAFLPPLPVTRENIINTADEHMDRLEDFFQMCLDWAIKRK